jgi:hypothetical protein
VSAPPVDSLRVDDHLTVEVDESQAPLRLVWVGRSTNRDPGKFLHPFFERVLVRARDLNKPVAMHFERLQQFNSSTIAALIQLINVARDRGVPLLVHYDRALKWQTLSFGALERAIAPFNPGGAQPVQFVPTKGE